MNDNFEPRIVGFMCNWCTYVAADMAGVARLKQPPNMTAIRMMCSGAVSPLYVISALKKGADGVFIGGCHIGDCHYQRGNHSTLKRIMIVKPLLEALGIDSRRVRLEWISASEGVKYAKVISEFVDQLKELGPCPLREA